MKPLIYLAGPISGLDYKGATGWRKNVIQANKDYMTFASPMRDKFYLRDKEDVSDVPKDEPLSTPRGIMTRDSWDVDRCDTVFANFLGATKVSIGTVMECAWAWRKHIPLIVVMEDDNIHQHPMLLESAGFVVPSLDEGVELLYSLHTVN